MRASTLIVFTALVSACFAAANAAVAEDNVGIYEYDSIDDVYVLQQSWYDPGAPVPTGSDSFEVSPAHGAAVAAPVMDANRTLCSFRASRQVQRNASRDQLGARGRATFQCCRAFSRQRFPTGTRQASMSRAATLVPTFQATKCAALS
jgi:hypothetical protein